MPVAPFRRLPFAAGRLALAVLLVAAGCGEEQRPQTATEPPEASLPDETSADALAALSCPWGNDQCAWPATAAPSLLVSADATQAREVGSRFVMQGRAFPGSVALKAMRGASSAGQLVVELRQDGTTPKGGALVASGRIDLALLCVTGEAACDAASQTKRIALGSARPVTPLVHAKGYWLRIFVAPATGGTADVWLAPADAPSAAAPLHTLLLGTGLGTTLSGQQAAMKYAAPSPDADLAHLLELRPAPAPGCADGIRNGDESDVDCGVACGKACKAKQFCRRDADCGGALLCRPLAGGLDDSSCRDGLCACRAKLALSAACASDRDCLSGRCSSAPGLPRRCELAACGDGVRASSGESDVDCGGKCVARCNASQSCAAATDCAPGLGCLGGICTARAPLGSACTVDAACASGLCLASTSGGSCGQPRQTGGACTRGVECASGLCTAKVCLAPTSADKVKNGDETDIDCGGTSGRGCAIKKGCEADGDCASGLSCSRGLCLKPAGTACAAAAECAHGICAGATGAKSCRAAPACNDGLKNGDETGIDCGGSCAATGLACASGKGCVRDGDCASGLCMATGLCAKSSCTDVRLSGTEVGVDCGGACGPCPTGTLSLDAASCASKRLTVDGRCAAPRCDDGVVNGTETGQDLATGRECGGTECAPCPRDALCKVASDCRYGTCPSATRRCTPLTSQAAGKSCELDVDCASGLACRCRGAACAAGELGLCISATLCNDGVKDNGESDVDCGGLLCGVSCADGKVCSRAGDCASGICKSGKCAAPSAIDKVKNGDETGIDCGGNVAPTCAEGAGCRVDADCASGLCDAARGRCTGANGRCNNVARVDCGRACGVGCDTGASCRGDVDCSSMLCVNGSCAASNCFVGGRPYPPGAPDPTNSCGHCDVLTPGSFTARPDGDACDDGSDGTWGDHCASGSCAGTASSCAASPLATNPCTASLPVADGASCLSDSDCPTGNVGQQRCIQGRCSGELCRTVPRAVEGAAPIACRTSRGACDAEERCVPGALECPPDRLAPPTQLCRASEGSCDPAERCDGTSADCGADQLFPSGTVCRASASACDAAERCGGQGPLCPEDRLSAEGDACRLSTGAPGVCRMGAALGCEAVPACLIGTAWVREGDLDASGCKACVPASSTSAWTGLPAGTPCLGGTCNASGACVKPCTGAGCPVVTPLITRVEPNSLHTQFDTGLWILGQRLAPRATATLIQGPNRVILSEQLSSPTALRVTAPAALATGLWDLEVTTPDGTTLMSGAVRVTDASFRTEVMNVGQGDASLITSPAGRTMLIDGSIFGMGQSRIVPRLAAPPDVVVVTHFDADHLAGVYEVLSGPDQLPNTADDVDPVDTLIDHGDNHACGSQLCQRYLTLRARLESIGKAREARPGEQLDLGGGASATVLFSNGRLADGTRLFTATENENSVGLLFEFGGFRYYSGGDITGGAIAGCNAALSGSFEDVEGPTARLTGLLDAMKVSHHGSCTATPLGFSTLAMPQVALTSVGTDNSYCHPAKRVLENLANTGADLMLTSPGVISANNTSGCALSERPASTAPIFGALTIDVPGDGTFSASAYNGTASWARSYTVREPRSRVDARTDLWPLPAGVALAGLPDRQPTEGALTLNLPRAPFASAALLLPWPLIDDLLLAQIDAGQTPPAALALDRRISGNALVLTPQRPLEPRSGYALVLPRQTMGSAAPVVVPFTSGFVGEGPRPETMPLPASPSGVIPNLATIDLTFDRPVRGLSDRAVYLEELSNGADAVFGTISSGSNRRDHTLRLPAVTRIGPGGVACSPLCPGLTYAMRFTGQIVDDEGRPVSAPLGTFTAGSCYDSGATTIQNAAVTPFGSAATVQFTGDEPLSGLVVAAPSGTLGSACGATPDGNCRTARLHVGECTASPCAPQAGACRFFATFEGLTPGVTYDFEVRTHDGAGNESNRIGGTLSTSTAPAFVVTEVLGDAPVSPEEQGEFIEVTNVGGASGDVCTRKLGRTTSELRDLCAAGASIPLAPGESALLTGGAFCSAAGTCTPAWPLPPALPIGRASTAKLFSTGVANSPLPTVLLMDSGVVQSSVTGGGSCPEGQARTRLSPYAPDMPGAFECRAASPGGP